MTPQDMPDDPNAGTENEGWAALDGVRQVREAETQLRAELARIDAVIAAPFLTPQGQACLAWLKTRVLDQPSWRMGDTLLAAYFAEGRKDVVRQLIASVERTAAATPGTAASAVRKRQPQTRRT